MELKEFLEKVKPHSYHNAAPPFDVESRHLWESMQLFSVIDCLKEDCAILDYGCGGNGTLQHTLFSHYPQSKYYGLDIKHEGPDNSGFNEAIQKNTSNNIYLGYIDELESILPKVDAMVMGSVFTHLSLNKMTDVLDKLLPHFNRGFQLGFTTFLGDDFEFVGSGAYGNDPETYGHTIIKFEWYKKYCEFHNLSLVLHPYFYPLPWHIPNSGDKQMFITIGKRVVETDILSQMILDVEESDILFYKPSETLWKNLSDDFSNIIKNKGIGNVQSQEFNNMFSYVLPCGSLKTEIPMWLYYNLLKSRDSFGILDKTQALPSDIYDFTSLSISGRPVRGNEKLLNWDYLISIDTIITLAEKNSRILQDHINICEIGAGWGRVGYYLTQINKNVSYHIFDIPHTLYVSHEYLKESVKHVDVYDYEESKKLLKEGANLPGIFFYTPHFLEEFKEKFFDLTINIASFQEMSPTQVAGYFKIINFLSKALYIQQRYSDLDMNYESYPTYENWSLLFDKDVNFHPLWFEKFYTIK